MAARKRAARSVTVQKPAAPQRPTEKRPTKKRPTKKRPPKKRATTPRAAKPLATDPTERHGAKVQRWIDLLAAFLCHKRPLSLVDLTEHVPAYAVAAKTDTAKRKQESKLNRMFERDKQELRAFGLAIESETDPDLGGVSRYRVVGKEFLLPLMHVADYGPPSALKSPGLLGIAVAPDELEFVRQAAVRVRQLGDPTLARAAETAIRKLAFDLAALNADEHGSVVVRGAGVDQTVLDRLGDAVRRGKRVTITYASIERNDTSTRTVEPYGLAFTSGHWYLIAGAPEAPVKHFRLSRIENLDVNAASPTARDFELPRGFSLPAHAASRHAWELGDGDAVDAHVRFTGASGAAARARALGGPVRGAPDQAVYRVRRTHAFVRWLLSLVGSAEPVGPPDIVAGWQRAVHDTLAVYGEFA